MTLHRDWNVPDGSMPSGSPPDKVIPKGRHEIERIPNPYGHEAPWLVLKGTLIGASEASWRQWENSTSDFKVIIEA